MWASTLHPFGHGRETTTPLLCGTGPHVRRLLVLGPVAERCCFADLRPTHIFGFPIECPQAAARAPRSRVNGSRCLGGLTKPGTPAYAAGLSPLRWPFEAFGLLLRRSES
jgi:hypothetical protein